MFVVEESKIDYAPDCHIIDHVDIYNTVDLEWMAMLLDMSDMSNEWRIFCHFYTLQWSMIGHDRGELRSIKSICQMSADPSKKGTARLGVKTHLYWDFIPVRNYTVPLLHVLIGVFNDVDDYVMDIID